MVKGMGSGGGGVERRERGESSAVAAESFNVLPEGCIANILCFTTPRDASRLCLVSTIFRSAADFDAVWDRFIPPDCLSAALSSNFPPYASKKDLYMALCEHPILIDQGTKSLSLDKFSGKKCYMLSARSLSIVWGDDPRYWRWIPLPEARFEAVAELLDVCWFEVHGKIDISMLSPLTLYSANFVFKTKVDLYGFQHHPFEITIGLVGGEKSSQSVFLDSKRGGGNQPRQRRDSWFEIELGEFFCDGVLAGELEMGVLEVRGGNWKSGLIIQGIELRPKRTLKRLEHRLVSSKRTWRLEYLLDWKSRAQRRKTKNKL